MMWRNLKGTMLRDRLKSFSKGSSMHMGYSVQLYLKKSQILDLSKSVIMGFQRTISHHAQDITNRRDEDDATNGT